VDDLSAIRRLKRGDIEVLGVLVERYQLEATRTAYLITGDAALAEDVMQEAFLRVYRHIGQFDEQRLFAPWFMRIVANAAVQAAQRQSRQMTLNDAEDSENWLDQLPDSAPGLDDVTSAAETRRMVWAALEQLSPEQRAVIVLRYYFDFSEQEMSETLQVQPGTIGWRLHAARKRLRGLLSPFWQPQEG
jgi:RNA polymerase sigma-70 factor (ECF subfamily)